MQNALSKLNNDGMVTFESLSFFGTYKAEIAEHMDSQTLTRRKLPDNELDQEDRGILGRTNPHNYWDSVIPVPPRHTLNVGSRARGLGNYNLLGIETISNTQQVPSWKFDLNSARTSTNSQTAYTVSAVRKVNDETTVTEKIESGLQVTTFKKGSRKRPRNKIEGMTVNPVGVTKRCTGEERERLDRNNAYKKKLNAVKQIKKQIKRLMDFSTTTGDPILSMALIYRNGKDYSYLGFSDVYDDFRAAFTQYIERKHHAQAGTRTTGAVDEHKSQTNVADASAQKSSPVVTPSGKLKV